MKKVNGTWHGQKPTKRPGRMKIIEMRSEMWLKAKPCRNQQALKDLGLIQSEMKSLQKVLGREDFTGFRFRMANMRFV